MLDTRLCVLPADGTLQPKLQALDLLHICQARLLYYVLCMSIYLETDSRLPCHVGRLPNPIINVVEIVSLCGSPERHAKLKYGSLGVGRGSAYVGHPIRSQFPSVDFNALLGIPWLHFLKRLLVRGRVKRETHLLFLFPQETAYQASL